MQQVKLLWLLIPLFLLFHGCEKDYTQEQGEEAQIVLTEGQKKFLDKSYVSRNNPFIKQTIGIITIRLNEFNCNGQEHPLEVGGTILDEGIHVEMYRKALRELRVPLDLKSYEEIWNVNLDFKIPFFEKPYAIAQHEIMAKEYVDDIAQALKELDSSYFQTSIIINILHGQDCRSMVNLLGLYHKI